MKLLVLVIAVTLALHAEDKKKVVPVHAQKEKVRVSVFNGTSACYTGVPSAGTMDLNGAELLTNPTFDAGTTGWTGALGGTVSSAPAGRIYSGAGALRMVSDGTANSYAKLTAPITDASTNSFTIEGVLYVPATNVCKTVRIIAANQAGANIAVLGSTVLTANTHTKTVLNFQATGAQTGINIFYQLNGPSAGDTLYVDNASLTQAYAAVVWVGGLNVGDRTFAAYEGIFAYGQGTQSDFRITGMQLAKTLRLTAHDNTGVVATGVTTTSIADGATHCVALALSRATNTSLYVDYSKAITPSIAALGRLSGAATFYIGSSGSTLLSGRIGQVYYIIYKSGLPADIDTIIARANWYYKTFGFVPARIWGPTATIVMNTPWTKYFNGGYGGDVSIYGNNLSPVGGVRVQ